MHGGLIKAMEHGSTGTFLCFIIKDNNLINETKKKLEEIQSRQNKALKEVESLREWVNSLRLPNVEKK